jgi:hypothetical protein
MIEAAGLSTSLKILASLTAELDWVKDENPRARIEAHAIAKSKY